MIDVAGTKSPAPVGRRPDGKRLRINIVGLDNGAGLSIDARLLHGLLSDAGFEVKWFKGVRPAKWLSRIARIESLRWLFLRHDLNLFLERIHPGWYPFARLNVLIPNPEWFRESLYPHLDGIDSVLCKTAAAETAFRRLHDRVSWVGFTSEDRWDGMLVAQRDPAVALHVAGRSEHKGTRQLIDVWARHPEWPALTVVQRPLDDGAELYAPTLPNVRYFSDRLSDERLLALQREHAIYVLPSEVEGFGQALVEGMSLGAVVVTADAAPMNELVHSDRGLLVAAEPGEPFRLAQRSVVNASALEAGIAEVLRWSVEQRTRVGSAARAWWVENDSRFRREFPIVLAGLISGK